MVVVNVLAGLIGKLAAQIEINLRSLRQKLQSDVGHRGCIAGKVASAGEEQVDVLAQLPCAAQAERHSEPLPRSFGELPNNSAPSVSPRSFPAGEPRQHKRNCAFRQRFAAKNRRYRSSMQGQN